MKSTFVSLKQVADFLPDTVIVVDEQIQIVGANDRITSLFGYYPQELIGQKLSMLLPHRYRGKHDMHFSNYFSHPEVRNMGVGKQFLGLRKDNTEVDIDIALAPFEANGRKLVIATIRDVTEKKELEHSLRKKNEQLKTVNTELERFGYMIAHDLKSPLLNIHALVQLMTRELPTEKSDKLVEYISALKTSLESMTRMISEVSAYSKADTSESAEEDIDLNLIIAEVRKLVHIPSNGRLDVDGQLPSVRGNRTKVLQVFVNLISNAFKHNDKEAPGVLVQGLQKGNTCLLSISDNGPGIPVQLRKRIFRLFDKGNSTRKDSQGIGLSIVKKIVEERGGEIIVNESPLGGAAFTFTWPGTTTSRETKSSDFDTTPQAASYQAESAL
ncbi:PAS domain-containing sensor histidine kinase [Pontibacter diazotrophicus]|uniref:histidine kinase n=1 Tax=Pontibacter diazotrophicus TaxID=1400979 RepID=A0A3D8L860_9BACT|nr:PAS domain-containing sensor histidine kinase [Pontibacter diazotrophicus]RDV13547.1 PAS domain-containing sensor histidine kinase [Pontibacter diazotrophicus]